MITKEIYLAGGCFWGVEAYLSRIYGVKSTTVGYANGKTNNPTYEEVCSLDTGHVETVKVEYDHKKVSLEKILYEFFKIIDPIAINRQGPDIGSQYRSGIYYIFDTDEEIIKNVLKEVQKQYKDKIATEVLPLSSFWPAEEYHQKYLEKNPNGYCHIDLSQNPYNDEINELSPIEYEVTQKNGTESPFSGKYNDFNEKGIYVDVVSGEVLFSSKDKFYSGCGWPSFSKPIEDDVVVKNKDKSHGMIRTEVRSSKADSHLGHVFDDGPLKLGGKRFCINSAALRFIPYENLDKEGYSEYKSLFE